MIKIIISGTTGVGKSTAVNLVKKHYEKEGKDVLVLGELVVDNPYFNLYFKEINSWGFLAQMDFLLQRFKQWMIIEESIKNTKENENKVIIYDRHFFEDLIFSELNLIKDTKVKMLSNVQKQVFKELLEKIDIYEKPHFFISLKASFSTIKERQFVQRKRKEEELFDNKYWQDLYFRYYGSKKYKVVFKKYSNHFVEIDTDDLTPDEVVEKITKYIDKRK